MYYLIYSVCKNFDLNHVEWCLTVNDENKKVYISTDVVNFFSLFLFLRFVKTYEDYRNKGQKSRTRLQQIKIASGGRT